MAKPADYINEMVFYVRRMPESEKTHLRKFIGGKRNSEALLSMLREFERCDLYGESVSQVKRLILLRGGKDHRLFQRFKSMLFDFEINSMAGSNARSKDNSEFVYMELKKELMVAQVMAEKDAYLNSIQSMKDIFRKSSNFEMLQIQKDCADSLSTFYQLSGDMHSADWWQNENMRLSIDIAKSYGLQIEVEKRITRISCCEFHNESLAFSTFEAQNSTRRRISWMFELLESFDKRSDVSNQISFLNNLRLFRELQKNPGLFPAHFRVSVTKLILEDLYRLGRTSTLLGFATSLNLLGRFPAYKRLPLIFFFLYFLFKSQRREELNRLIENVRRNSTFSHFHNFMIHVEKIDLLQNYLDGHDQEVLRRINRTEELSSHCTFQDFDLRCIELLSLYRSGQFETAHDKVENMRRFIFRNQACRNALYCRSIYNTLRSLVLHREIPMDLTTIEKDESVYDLRPLIMSLASNAIGRKIYKEADQNLSIAAEDRPPFRHGASK